MNGLRLRRFRDTPLGYAFAGAGLVVALAVRTALDPWVTIPFATLFPAVIVAGIVGGRLAGMLVMVLGGLVAGYLWLSPYSATPISWQVTGFNVALYLLTAAAILYLVSVLNEALDAVEHQNDRSAHLFHELQHRTANNLQSAAALIRFSMRRAQKEPSAAVDILDATYKRFETMSRIHRRLYRANRAPYPVERELSELCQEVLAALGARHVSCEVSAPNLELDQDRMLPVSLLVVELLINSVKHAFAPGAPGRIDIAFDSTDSHYTLHYRDDGKGLPPDLDFLSSDSLGSRIMQGFVTQLGGVLRYEAGRRGAYFAITFPVKSVRAEVPADAQETRIVVAE